MIEKLEIFYTRDGVKHSALFKDVDKVLIDGKETK